MSNPSRLEALRRQCTEQTEERAPAIKASLVERFEVVESRKRQSKVIRDSFSMPPEDWAILEELQARNWRLGYHRCRSELVRAGLRALQAMPDHQYQGLVESVERVVTGRPPTEA